MNVTLGFPDENIDPKEKLGDSFLKQYCEAAISRYNRLPMGTIGWASRERYDEYELYARGSQPVSKYKAVYNNGEDGENKLMVVDWRILPIMPKYINVAVSMLGQISFRPQINPIDDKSLDELEQEITKNEAKIAIRQELEKMGANEQVMGLPSLQFDAGEADNYEDLAVKDLGLKHATAIELEQLTEAVFNYNNFTDLFNEFNADLVKHGVAVVSTDIVNDAEVVYRREDPRRLVMSYCQNNDFSDWRYIGVVRSIPCSSIVANSNGKISKADIMKIYDLGQSGMQQLGFEIADWGTYGSADVFYNRGSLWVLDIQIRSSDKKVLEERESKEGNPIAAFANPKAERKSSKKYEEVEYENIYCAKWIIGTDILYGKRKKKNTLRNEINLSKVEPSIRVYGCQVWQMAAKSRIEGLITYADSIQYAFYKLQHILNTQVQAGYAIDFDKIEALDLGAGAEKVQPKDVLNLFFDRGILMFRGKDVDGNDSNGLPILPISNKSANDLAEYWNMINYNVSMMRDALGINDLTDGSNPNARMASDIAKAAIGGTKNAFGDIYVLQRRLVKDLTQNTVRYSQYIVQDGKTDLLKKTMGAGSIRRFKRLGDIDKYLYSVTIEEFPTQEELLALQEQIKIAQQNKELFIDNIVTLSNMKNLKEQQAYLVNVVRKNRELNQQQELMSQQQNGSIQIQSAQAAEEAKRQTIQLEVQLKTEAQLKIIQAQTESSLALKQLDLERERIAATGRIESAEVQALGRDINNQRDNAYKAMLAPEANDAPKVDVQNLKFDSTVTPQTSEGGEINMQEFDFSL